VESHVGDPAQAGAVIETVRGEGIDVCALTWFGNLLDSDPARRSAAHETVRATVDAAAASGAGLVVVFPGRDDTAGEDANYKQLADFFNPLSERARQGNVRIAIENWPGPDKNYVATTPEGWSRLFALAPHPNLVLNFDPSHLVWQGIDPEQALREISDRVFLAHAKDTEIFRDRLQQTGYFGSGWWTYRLPGYGSIDWTRWLALLGELEFNGVVSIEHEDPDWGATRDGSLSRRQDGLREGLRVLQAAAADG
jgi:sugar phosphate isomerase/epimerase